MKKLLLVFSLSLALLIPVVAGAVENKVSWATERGGYTISDTVVWRNSVSGTSRNTRLDTLVGSADQDTSRTIIPMAGATSVTLQHVVRAVQGTAGDPQPNTSRLTIIPQFSVDGVSWTDFVVDTTKTGQGLSVTTCGVVFSEATSPLNISAASEKWHLIKPLPKTTVIADSMYNRLRTIPDVARFMRLRAVNRENGAADSVFLTTIYNLTYPK